VAARSWRFESSLGHHDSTQLIPHCRLAPQVSEQRLSSIFHCSAERQQQRHECQRCSCCCTSGRLHGSYGLRFSLRPPLIPRRESGCGRHFAVNRGSASRDTRAFSSIRDSPPSAQNQLRRTPSPTRSQIRPAKYRAISLKHLLQQQRSTSWSTQMCGWFRLEWLSLRVRSAACEWGRTKIQPAES
jgi:hypothetical protein